MDAELKAKWVKALRSGEFAQARGRLKDGNSFCCLGVLASLQGAEWSEGIPIIRNRSAAYSPTNVLFMDAAGGMTIEQQQKLAALNDGDDGHSPHSFTQLADYIEREL